MRLGVQMISIMYVLSTATNVLRHLIIQKISLISPTASQRRTLARNQIVTFTTDLHLFCVCAFTDIISGLLDIYHCRGVIVHPSYFLNSNRALAAVQTRIVKVRKNWVQCRQIDPKITGTSVNRLIPRNSSRNNVVRDRKRVLIVVVYTP